jgi:molybdopterin synthase catalytic subunit
MFIKVQAETFDGQKEIQGLFGNHANIGAVVTFTGYVRSDDGLTSLTLEHYPGMTEKTLKEIADLAKQRWKIDDGIIIHRYGTLYPGEPIVFVGILSEHRNEAFEAASFLMDWLKTKAPFWKFEDKGSYKKWVEAKVSDDAAAQKWDT